MAVDPITLAFFAFLLSGKKGGGSSEWKGLTGRMAISTPNELLNRAIQPRAASWVPFFLDVGETPAVADALSRWTGLESGGDPTIISSLGERGLLQVGRQTQSEGGITSRDWDELADPNALPNEHARIASGYWRWLFTRAMTHLEAPVADGTDQVWFAYQYHQRPKDFTQWGPLPSSAAAASAYLLGRAHINEDHELEKRVVASNVVAWGTPEGPIPPMVSGVADVRQLQPPDTLPGGTRVFIYLGAGPWYPGTVEGTGYSVTLDATGDSKTLYDPSRYYRLIPLGWS